MSILIDSDILIEVSRGADKKVLDSWTHLSDSDEVLLCPPVTMAELRHGAQAQRTRHFERGDALIAATATIQEAALWTRNRKHYPMRSLTFF